MSGNTDPAKNGLNVVAIGGGNGLSTLLSGLKDFVSNARAGKRNIANLSAIVAVSDDGGSSGRLREELQMLPPGDIRNCMVALSEDSLLLSRLFKYRFRGNGDLGGHSFGNLFLAALTEITGDFATAITLSSEILASKGHIFPATLADVRIGAELKDGRIVRGETEIGKVGPAIKRLFLDPPDCLPPVGAVKAIEQADVITIGPGSLYTSLLPPLLVNGLGDAIGRSKAIKIFVSNLMTQPGETDGYTSADHFNMINGYLPQIDSAYVLVNNEPISPKQAEIYEPQGSVQIGIHGSLSKVVMGRATVVYAKLLSREQKVRHDPRRLAEAVLDLSIS